MNLFSQFMPRTSLRKKLLQAEVDARLNGHDSSDEGPNRGTPSFAGAGMTDEDEIRYRRIMAKLHFGKNTAKPEYEALLTEGEKDYLGSHIIHQRWAELWLQQNRNTSSEDR